MDLIFQDFSFTEPFLALPKEEFTASKGKKNL